MSVSIVLLWGNHGAVVGHLVALWGRHGAVRGIKGLPPPVDMYILVLGLVARWNCTILKLEGQDAI